MTDQRPSPESVAKEVTTFLDAHTCQHSPGCLVCMLEERIVLALTRAYQDGERAGMERAAGVADEWAASGSCTSHTDDPCCHVRTGFGIAAAIRAAIPAPDEEKR